MSWWTHKKSIWAVLKNPGTRGAMRHCVTNRSLAGVKQREARKKGTLGPSDNALEFRTQIDATHSNCLTVHPAKIYGIWTKTTPVLFSNITVNMSLFFSRPTRQRNLFALSFWREPCCVIFCLPRFHQFVPSIIAQFCPPVGMPWNCWFFFSRGKTAMELCNWRNETMFMADPNLHQPLEKHLGHESCSRPEEPGKGSRGLGDRKALSPFSFRILLRRK